MSDQNSGDAVIGTVSDGIYTLIIADFADTDSAKQAYEALKEVEDGRTVEVERRGHEGMLWSGTCRPPDRHEGWPHAGA